MAGISLILSKSSHQGRPWLQEYENMYIVADLSSKDAPSETTDSEALLCTISYDPLHKILTISPDFSSDECYSVEGPGMAYDFWIEHVSQKPSPRELQRYRDSIKKVRKKN